MSAAMRRCVLWVGGGLNANQGNTTCSLRILNVIRERSEVMACERDVAMHWRGWMRVEGLH